MKKPKEILLDWVDLFNKSDAKGIAELYHDDAINHQVVFSPVKGKSEIYAMFKREFSNAVMVCIVENIFTDGDWAILEWKDPQGLRGCGFFNIIDGKIKFQRGYWDRLSFQELHKKDLR
jgi:limonene-1,2-epoxide hydrolase